MGEPQDVTAERIVRDLLMPYANNNSNATITVQGAAPWQLWVCATACLVTLAVTLVAGAIGGVWLSREFTRIDSRAEAQEVKIDRANTFLSAIWAQAPELESQVKAKIERDKKNAE